ncbi:MAG TPA: methyltransferase domain-containing protein [Candidatus Acidoferrales bacterium]|nr:methyltransferase domain-containing protein [Candidatus Acidoferrales bacterium]
MTIASVSHRPHSVPGEQRGLRKRIFAWTLHKFNGRYEQKIAARKLRLLGGLKGTVIEIGPGTGPNLRYYANTVRWIGIEPNLYMRGYLKREAERTGVTAELRDGRADALECANNSADAVVSTLVLCSVPDLRGALSEILRVLKPGGRFVFIEHVAAPPGTRLRKWQHRLRPWFHFFADGCNPDRETWRAIESAGFAEVRLEHFDGPVPLVRPHVAGVAIKKVA